MGVGKYEHAPSSVASPDVGYADAVPLRIEPEVGQVSENTSECSQNRPSVFGTSHASRAVFQRASGFG